MSIQIDQVIKEVFDLYQHYGHEDYIGEPVSQLEHMSQSAVLAMNEGYDDEVVLAAFFHDIGHLCMPKDNENSMDGYGIKRHEQIGADYLRSMGFSERMAKLVENHVQAKRYLTFKKPEYYDKLSSASKQTLLFQGGIMNSSEAHTFEIDPLFDASIRMRYWDELAKEMHIPIVDLDMLKSKARSVLSSSLPVV